MGDYGSPAGYGFGPFSSNEKTNYALKIALSRVQTDTKRAWYNEPRDYIPKGPKTLYKNELPSYSDISKYYLIDDHCTYHGVTKSIVTNVRVREVLNNANTYSSYGVGTASSNSTRKFTNSDNIRKEDYNHTTVNKAAGLSPNMFTRYAYWKEFLTGKYANTRGTGGGRTTSDSTLAATAATAAAAATAADAASASASSADAAAAASAAAAGAAVVAAIATVAGAVGRAAGRRRRRERDEDVRNTPT